MITAQTQILAAIRAASPRLAKLTDEQLVWLWNSAPPSASAAFWDDLRERHLYYVPTFVAWATTAVAPCEEYEPKDETCAAAPGPVRADAAPGPCPGVTPARSDNAWHVSTFECRCCGRFSNGFVYHTGGMSQMMEPGWRYINKINGQNRVCPTCIANGHAAKWISDVRESDEFPDTELGDEIPCPGATL